MITNIPPKILKRWTGMYPGNFYGTIWKTFNVDMDKEEGKVSLSRRSEKIFDTSDTTGLSGVINAFIRTNADNTDRWWALQENGNLFKTTDTDPDSGWNSDSLDSSPTDARDFSVFENDSDSGGGQNQFFVTRDTDIAVLNDTAGNNWNNNWWVTTKSQTALRAGVPHPITSFPFRRLVLIGDGNLLHTIDKNEDITRSRLILPVELQIEYIFTTTRRAWILCSNIFSGNGSIVEWDGKALSPNEIHDAYSVKPLSGVNYREIPIVINNKGLILEYSGNGFTPMVRNGQKITFPSSEEPGNFLSTTSISPRGMTVSEDGLVYINTREPNTGSYRQGAGIWCLNPLTGRLYNKHSIGQWGDSLDYGQQTISDVGASKALPASLSDRGFLIGGADYNVYTGTTENAIWALETPTSTTGNRGYFITQFIPADDVRDFWETIWIRFKRFITSSNSIIIKGRGVRSLQLANGNPLDTTITWTGDITFTLTLAASDDVLEVGDEVEVLAGDNAGLLAHILSISGDHAALQTITIDEPSPQTSSTASLARFERWKKLGIIDNATKYEDKLNVGISGSFIQFKVEMRGPHRELEVESLITSFKKHTNAE